MASRKGFPLRLEPAVYDALQRWGDDEMRSMNAQIEFLLRDALRRAGRLPARVQPSGGSDDCPEETTPNTEV